MTYSRIRRGPMAADAFTQIRNAVFRDARLSAKAMGIFGNISTHRDGWGITPETISTQMRDGVDSIKAGLRELEKHGYLQRERERRANGTLGASTYYITDEPVLVENARSAPEGDSPPLDEPPVDDPAVAEPPEVEPTLVNPPHKKISSKNTGGKHTVPPSGSTSPDAPAPGGTDGERVPELAMPSGGLAVLLEVARRRPVLALAGRPLRDQAVAVEGRLAVGWAPVDLAAALSGEPPAGMRSAGAVLAARIRALGAPPSPEDAPDRPGGAFVPRQAGPAAPSAPPVRKALADPPPSCATCSAFPAPGEDQCPACLGWLLCASGCGRRTPDGAECDECVRATLEAALRAPETPDGDCPCGRPAVTLGWCSRCRVAAETDLRAMC